MNRQRLLPHLASFLRTSLRAGALTVALTGALAGALSAAPTLAALQRGGPGGPGGSGGRGDSPPARPDNTLEVPTEAGIAWYGSWDVGLAEAKRTGRPILLMSAAPQCHGVPGMW